jgi:hypothetical protein
VIAVYQDMLTFNGLPAAAAAGADPVGNIDALQRIPQGVRIQGWTLDPSDHGPTPVDVYVNGIGLARRMADGSRPDVAAAFHAASANHGFDITLPILGGTVCVYAINIGSGVRNPLLGCRFVRGPDPSGDINALYRRPNGLRVRGWTLDWDSTSPTYVDVYANGVGVARLRAGTSRPDVGAAFPGYGDAHGFNKLLRGVGGRVCLYAINIGPGSNNTLFGCRTVLGVDPVGNVDGVTRGPNGVRVCGWTLDPDSGGPAMVDIYANGIGLGRIAADRPRPDIAHAFPGYGGAHGFDVVVPVGGTICAYGINTGPGNNALLGCRNV